ncbi:DUF2283 domain-containing protein [Methanothrix sp.]|uniref:DUF2283 domain-containing protein n=1 Tax=Methanothrix sp. TaxID=90426 RepID=UPI00257EE566|nr:DUF2283 domain-containing protein [Methanothrix sp.]NPU87122.1 DUF2283 domain-containing protein [Methanothrix sp.]
MKISYDPEHDVMYLKLLDGVVAETVEIEPNILIDYGEHKEVLGIEIINVSGLIKANPLEEIIIKVQERARA